MTLNKKSHQSLVDGIPISSLPPTFRDACFVTQQLGVNYIWIDALCIFQDKDDLSDWSREASLMEKVYSNSYCNIVAAENRNSSEPLLRERNPKSLCPPTTETLLRKQNLHSQLNQDAALSEKYIVDHLGYWAPVRDAHINTRGWVMQERFLSPRALQFGTHQVYWECRRSMASETNPDGHDIFGIARPFKALMKAPHGHYSWLRLVMGYSVCELTFPSDKLVAFSAIARLYASYLSDEYVAGMWRGSLQNDLLWWAFDSSYKNEPTRHKTYTAPTWSWASIKGEVFTAAYESDRMKYLYEVNDYKLEYVTDDIMGAIRSGWLRLSGQLHELQLLRETTDGGSLWTLRIDNIVYTREYTGRYGEGLWLSVWLDEPQTDFAVENENGTLYCMPVRHHLFNEMGDQSNMWDLFLFHLVDTAQGNFRRIGMARIRTGDCDNPPFMEDLGGATSRFTQTGVALPCAAYENGIHSIIVI